VLQDKVAVVSVFVMVPAAGAGNGVGVAVGVGVGAGLTVKVTEFLVKVIAFDGSVRFVPVYTSVIIGWNETIEEADDKALFTDVTGIWAMIMSPVGRTSVEDGATISEKSMTPFVQPDAPEQLI
jgi:hypothetical protein